MVEIVTRDVGATAKGEALTNSEVDQNFINLNEGLDEVALDAQNLALVMSIALG